MLLVSFCVTYFGPLSFISSVWDSFSRISRLAKLDLNLLERVRIDLSCPALVRMGSHFETVLQGRCLHHEITFFSSSICSEPEKHSPFFLAFSKCVITEIYSQKRAKNEYGINNTRNLRENTCIFW